MNRELGIRERIAHYGLELDGHNRGAWDRARDDLEVHAYSDLRYLMDEIASLRAENERLRAAFEAALGWADELRSAFPSGSRSKSVDSMKAGYDKWRQEEVRAALDQGATP